MPTKRTPNSHYRQFAERYARGAMRRAREAVATAFNDADAGPSTLAAALLDERQALADFTAVDFALPASMSDDDRQRAGWYVSTYPYRAAFIDTLAHSNLFAQLRFPLADHSTSDWLRVAKAEVPAMLLHTLSFARGELSPSSLERIAREGSSRFLDELMEDVRTQNAGIHGARTPQDVAMVLTRAMRDFSNRPNHVDASTIQAWNVQRERLQHARMFLGIHAHAWREGVAIAKEAGGQDIDDAHAAEVFFGDKPAAEMTIDDLRDCERRVYLALEWKHLLPSTSTPTLDR